MALAHTVHEIALANGTKGLVIDVPGATAVNYEFSFRAGYEYVARPEIQQVAHLMEHMAFGPNEQFLSAESYSQEFSRNGADSNATTNETAVTYYGTSALMEFDRILELWRVALVTPRFTSELLHTERENVREELEGALSDDEEALSQRVGRATGSTALLTEEKLATLDEITLDDITEHYRRTHTSDNMRFVLCGALADRIDGIVRLFEAWQLPRGKQMSLAIGVVRRGEAVSLYRQHMTSCSFNFSIMASREFSPAERDAMAALDNILTGTMHSRIYGEARRRGICYGMGSSFIAYKDQTSEWTFTGRVSERNARELYELVTNVIRDIAVRGVTDEELSAAKQSAHGRLQLIGQTPEELSDAYSGAVFYDEPIVSFEQFPARIDAVTNDMIVRLVRELIDANAWAFGEVGPIEEAATYEREQIFARVFEPHEDGV